MWIIKYQDDTMPDAEVKDTHLEKTSAVKQLREIAIEKQDMGRTVVWSGELNFTYRSYENTYSIHYWLEEVRM